MQRNRSPSSSKNMERNDNDNIEQQQQLAQDERIAKQPHARPLSNASSSMWSRMLHGNQRPQQQQQLPFTTTIRAQQQRNSYPSYLDEYAPTDEDVTETERTGTDHDEGTDRAEDSLHVRAVFAAVNEESERTETSNFSQQKQQPLKKPQSSPSSSSPLHQPALLPLTHLVDRLAQVNRMVDDKRIHTKLNPSQPPQTASRKNMTIEEMTRILRHINLSEACETEPRWELVYGMAYGSNKMNNKEDEEANTQHLERHDDGADNDEGELEGQLHKETLQRQQQQHKDDTGLDRTEHVRRDPLASWREEEEEDDDKETADEEDDFETSIADIHISQSPSRDRDNAGDLDEEESMPFEALLADRNQSVESDFHSLVSSGFSLDPMVHSCKSSVTWHEGNNSISLDHDSGESSSILLHPGAAATGKPGTDDSLPLLRENEHYHHHHHPNDWDDEEEEDEGSFFESQSPGGWSPIPHAREDKREER